MSALTGCSGALPEPVLGSASIGSRSPVPTATITVTVAPSAVPASAAAPDPSLITFTSVGPITTAMDFGSSGKALGAVPTETVGNPYCLYSGFAGDSDDDVVDPLTPHLAALAESGGAFGPLDVIELDGPASGSARESPGVTLPRTAEGIGIGSSLADLRAAYGERLTLTPAYYQPELQIAGVAGSDGTGMRFALDAQHRVTQVSVGRTPQLDYVEHCA